MLSNFFKWEEGRKKSGYYKFKIFESKRLLIDCYLLKFPEGSVIDKHIDPVKKGYEHHRFNIVLKRAKIGGDFFIKEYDNFICKYTRFIKFRPDINEHYATPIKLGSRYVLSFGWLKKHKN